MMIATMIPTICAINDTTTSPGLIGFSYTVHECLFKHVRSSIQKSLHLLRQRLARRFLPAACLPEFLRLVRSGYPAWVPRDDGGDASLPLGRRNRARITQLGWQRKPNEYVPIKIPTTRAKREPV